MLADSEPPRAQRLFFALWPQDTVRERISVLVLPHLEGRKARKVRLANLHVTLAFLGAVAFEDVPKVATAADRICGEVFDLTLDHLESWRRAHVACIAIEPIPTALLDLAERLRFSLLQNEVEVDRKEFRAHVTVARDWRDARLDERIGPLVWPVREFVLVESKSGHRGPDYYVLKRWPLGRAAHE